MELCAEVTDVKKKKKKSKIYRLGNNFLSARIVHSNALEIDIHIIF